MSNSYLSKEPTMINLFSQYSAQAPGIRDEDRLLLRSSPTIIAGAEMVLKSAIHLRFETEVSANWDKGSNRVCQYVDLDLITHELVFRKEFMWFVPGDVTFNTFDEALKCALANPKMKRTSHDD